MSGLQLFAKREKNCGRKIFMFGGGLLGVEIIPTLHTWETGGNLETTFQRKGKPTVLVTPKATLVERDIPRKLRILALVPFFSMERTSN